MKKIVSVVGARPNFMKIAPVIEGLQSIDPWNGNMKHFLVHTGQHFGSNMSDLFFSELNIPQPDINLGIKGGDHGEQTGRIMIEFEKVIHDLRPDIVLVVGDVNSTLAAAIVAAKKGIRVAHIESGLRSGDMGMPEEINRVITDQISDLLFVTEESAMQNLEKEGIRSDKIFFVGNVMIDTLLHNIDRCKNLKANLKYGLQSEEFCLITLHRPSNVDDLERLSKLVDFFNELAEEIDLMIPLHPRTEINLKKIDKLFLLEENPRIKITGPLGYFDFISIMSNSVAVITDSGGVQEESTILNIRCFTARQNTERPATITHGTNTLLPWDINEMASNVKKALKNKNKLKPAKWPKFWDGNTAERIIRVLHEKI